MPNFKPHAVALAMLALLAAAAQAQQTSNIGTVTVTGEGDKLGTGLLIDDDTPKAKSTVTRAQLEKQRSSTNPFQSLNLLPGVNATSYDATGLFGGNLRVRGFNSDQMGFTINGAPVNDSGSFSVFPQEYTDAENLCEMFVTQGATDTEAPHVGASGGNVGLLTCGPEDKYRFRFAQSFGQLDYSRSFVRVDSGKVGDLKGFVSYSKSRVDKWKGSGAADRQHVDAGAEYDLGRGSKLSASLLYNSAVVNNFRSLRASDLAAGGYYTDFALTPPAHLPAVAGTAQNEAAIASGTAFYGYALNPFRNYLATGKANIQLNDKMRLDVEPYFWYGYGTGGVQQTSVAESSNSGTRLHNGIADINGDGDTLDTVMVYRGSLTETYRPGVTTKLSYTLDNHKILAGFWFEKARHRQTQPAVRVDSNGNVADIWLANYRLQYNDGSLYQGRSWSTESTGKSYFAQDTIDLGKLQVTPAISYRTLRRDFTNYGNSGTNAGADYNIVRTYPEWLPSLNASYMFNDRTQGFVGVAKNYKVPGNFDFASLASGVTYAGGVGTAAGQIPLTVKPETSVNIDLGARYRGDMFKTSATAFLVKFKNRIAQSFDPIAGITHDWNVGDSTVKGIEAEIGTVPVKGYSAYASYTYTRSTIDNDMLLSAVATYPTAGMTFPDTPKQMAALSLQYAEGPYMVNLQAKFTGSRFLTLVNDYKIGGFTTVDLNAAYKVPTPVGSPFKNATLRLNLSNIFSRKYYLANSGSGSNIQINAAGNPTIYTGAPRFASVTFQVDY
jgi:iron complex outermembrane receptor protein